VTYRTMRCNAFVSKHWAFSHALTLEEYDFLGEISGNK